MVEKSYLCKNNKSIRTAIFCDRPMHVFNALNYAYHNLNDSLGKADLFIIAAFKNAGEIAAKINKENIFAHVFVLQEKEKRQNLSKWQHEFYNLERFLFLQDPVHIFLQEELSNFTVTPGRETIDWHYDIVCTSSWSMHVWQELVVALGGKTRIFFMDDGFFSYRASNILNLRVGTFGQGIRKLFRRGRFGFRIERLYLSNPEMCRFTSKKIFALPKMESKDLQFRQIEERVFGKAEVLTPVIFLGQMIKEPVHANVPALYQELFTILTKTFSKDKFSVRLHPRQTPKEFLDTEQVQLKYGQTLWEINCREVLKDTNILIGFSSTALVTPKLFLGQEPTVICLYRLLGWKDKQRLQDTEDFFYAVRSKYKDKSRFCIVDSIEQFKAIIENTKLV